MRERHLKSEVSRICQGLNVQVQAFLNRLLEVYRYPYPYVYHNATYLHARDQARKQVISDAHPGLKKAIGRQLQGCG